jgi:hypothetical protein
MCLKCRTTGRECEGFDIRLTWFTTTQEQLHKTSAVVTSKGLFPRREDNNIRSISNRRPIVNGTTYDVALPSYSDLKLDEFLLDVQLSSERQGHDPFQQGPFGVFPSESRWQQLSMHANSPVSNSDEQGGESRTESLLSPASQID